MRITPCESTPRRLAHTTASAHAPAISGGTPAAVKIAAANVVRSDLLRIVSSLMATAASRAEQCGRAALLRINPRELHRLGNACDLVLERLRICVGSAAGRLDPGDGECLDDVRLLHGRDRFGGEFVDDRLRGADTGEQADHRRE